jgi:hypothetical protein
VSWLCACDLVTDWLSDTPRDDASKSVHTRATSQSATDYRINDPRLSKNMLVQNCTACCAMYRWPQRESASFKRSYQGRRAPKVGQQSAASWGVATATSECLPAWIICTVARRKVVETEPEVVAARGPLDRRPSKSHFVEQPVALMFHVTLLTAVAAKLALFYALMPELYPSAQRCLPRFFTGNFNF